ncbi:hypothetical protein RSOLAG22IIIB_05947 [Rhizoctonia solani]|uniref:Major facilitator superfamily (MFS) profile domain-containing protein n=1 Tax=Rhizoctonia solani TaxID=456999 RepID=A0A0K6GB11_9AGAM|nr:hypothetical protein RSOLAG22IIIB_05947 [Rhizoctonia solani]
MSTSVTTQVYDLPASELPREKSNINVVNPRFELPAPPHVVVRARSTTEGIEMNVLGRNRNNEGVFSGDDNSSFNESGESSRKEWAAVTACSLCLFLSGWHDGSIGLLIPTIQNYYNLTFTVVSVLFVSGCLGFMLSAILNVHLSDHLGFGRVMFLGGICQVISNAMLVPAFPFPVMVIGIGLQDALANGFVSALRNNPSAKMGIIHSLYGKLPPPALSVITTQFANQPHWSYLYMIPLVISTLNLAFSFSTFRFHTQEELLGPIQPADPVESASNERKYRQVFGSWTVHVMALFCLLYVGAETTIGGWIVTFLVEERGGGTSAGYISSGYFGGLMLGRIGLIWLNEKVGERRVVYGYVLLAIGLEMTVWMLPHLLGNAIALTLVGVLMGMNVLRTTIPKWLLTGSMGWVASVGQAGAALFPFLTGILIQKYGVGVLQPILVALLGGMTIPWALVPSDTKRRGD